MTERVKTTPYLWVSRLAGLAGVICVILSFISGITGVFIVIATPSTLLEAAIAAFLFAIWAVLYEIRDLGIKSR